MPVILKKVKRKNLRDPKGPSLWYPIVKSLGVLKEKEVAKKIADETTLNPKEAEMAIYQLPKVIIDGLLNGQTVQLGELGTFRLTVSGKGMETEKGVDANSVKQANVRFIPSASFKDSVQKVVFVVKESI